MYVKSTAITPDIDPATYAGNISSLGSIPLYIDHEQVHLLFNAFGYAFGTKLVREMQDIGYTFAEDALALVHAYSMPEGWVPEDNAPLLDEAGVI